MPPFTAFAQALNWMSHARCSAAASLTNVFPLTSNGRVESPEDVTGGAAMPPRALALDEAEVELEADEEEEIEAVELEKGAAVLEAAGV